MQYANFFSVRVIHDIQIHRNAVCLFWGGGCFTTNAAVTEVLYMIYEYPVKYGMPFLGGGSVLICPLNEPMTDPAMIES
jgi:hypothetical protein